MTSSFNLDGRVIVLTGAAGLLGTGFARALAEHGAKLALLDTNASRLESLVSEIRAEYSSIVLGLEVDITDESQVASASREVQNQMGSIYGLINNAARNPAVSLDGLEKTSRLEKFDLNEWNQDLSVGLSGAFLCAKYFGVLIKRSKSVGVIINISSDLGLISPDQRLYEDLSLPPELRSVKPVSYSVVKAGIIGLSRYLATYWPGEVRSNTLCFGGVENNQSDDFVDRISRLIPLGRMAELDEYSDSVVYMMSDAASYMNGAVVVLDGGRSTW